MSSLIFAFLKLILVEDMTTKATHVIAMCFVELFTLGYPHEKCSFLPTVLSSPLYPKQKIAKVNLEKAFEKLKNREELTPIFL